MFNSTRNNQTVCFRLTGATMTARKSAETHIRENLGPAAEFTPDELLTLRSVLMYGLHLQQKQLVANETNRRNYPIKGMASDIIGPLIAQWQRANIQFTPPITVHRYTLERRVLTVWSTISDIVRMRASSQTSTDRSDNTDRQGLFYVCRCKCTIQRCADVAGCNV